MLYAKEKTMFEPEFCLYCGKYKFNYICNFHSQIVSTDLCFSTVRCILKKVANYINWTSILKQSDFVWSWASHIFGHDVSTLVLLKLHMRHGKIFPIDKACNLYTHLLQSVQMSEHALRDFLEKVSFF
jgi:hypothetical protein